MKRTLSFTLILLALLANSLLLFPAPAAATTGYSLETGFPCSKCHVDAIGGGPLTEAGSSFLAELQRKGAVRPLTLVQRLVRFFVGYLHLLAAIVWFGTIMYVHILLKPAYASKGLPRGELRLGWLSMVALLVTGVLLTFSRIPSWDTFLTTRFGILLAIKIALFLVMLSSALVVTLFIGPRLRTRTTSPVADLMSATMTAEQLAHFDGKDGRPAYIAYKGIVYNVSQGRLWKNGSHVARHAAGNDLTDILAHAPHGDEKVLAMPQVGSLSAATVKPALPFHMRLFYGFAYMNLVLVFVIIFIIALWRWW